MREKKICIDRTQIFRASLRKFMQKSFAPPKIGLPLLHLWSKWCLHAGTHGVQQARKRRYQCVASRSRVPHHNLAPLAKGLLAMAPFSGLRLGDRSASQIKRSETWFVKFQNARLASILDIYVQRNGKDAPVQASILKAEPSSESFQ